MSVITFDPPIKPSYGSELNRVYSLAGQRTHAGYDVAMPRSVRGLIRGQLVWDAVDEGEKDYIVSFLDQFHGHAGPFEWSPTDKIESPLGITPTLSEVAGGSLPERTYYIGFTWYDSTHLETKLSAVASILVAANKFVKVAVPLVPNRVEGFRVYGSETEGAPVLQATVTVGNSWTQSAAFATGTAPPPNSNQLNPPIKFYALGEVKKRRIGPDVWSLSLDIVEQLI